MNWIETHLLSAIIWSPLVGVVPLWWVKSEKAQRAIAFLTALAPFFLTLLLFKRFRGEGGFEFNEVIPWFQGFHIFYRLGIDGLSLLLIGLTVLLFPIVILASIGEIQKRQRGFLALLLGLETGILGVFSSLDLFLFYVFWEAMLIPMYFLIGIWGGERRIYAALKFVIYTMVGSLLMLAAILYLYFAARQSFYLGDWYLLQLPATIQTVLFAAFGLAFAIKIPLFPFHTWLPDAHTEAPTAGSVILAGVLLKMGTYGFARFAMPLFPQATISFLPIILILSVIGVLYGALVSMVQPDLKKLVAYSSVSHLGFVMLGLASLTPQGVAGAGLQMVNHGISTGALFLLVGMIYQRRHTREISQLGGLAQSMPLYSLCFFIVVLSSLGLPGNNGFVGEFLILLGLFKSAPIFSALAGIGVIFTAVYLLWMFRRAFFGPMLHEENRKLGDLSLREAGLLLPLIVLIFWIGLAPGYFLKKLDQSVEHFLDRTIIFTHGDIK